jgi:hypothetical protein
MCSLSDFHWLVTLSAGTAECSAVEDSTVPCWRDFTPDLLRPLHDAIDRQAMRKPPDLSRSLAFSLPLSLSLALSRSLSLPPFFRSLSLSFFLYLSLSHAVSVTHNISHCANLRASNQSIECNKYPIDCMIDLHGRLHGAA